jgi:hypothetical protein
MAHHVNLVTVVATCRSSDYETCIALVLAHLRRYSGQLSASLAAGTPVDLRDTLTGLDNVNVARLVTAAIRHASGKRPKNNRHR